MKAVITGANSFLGQSLSATLFSRGWQVVQVARRPFNTAHNMQQVYLSMSEYEHLGEAVGPCDCFIHLAWNGTRGNARMDSKLQNQNVVCSLNALKSMLRYGCRRVLSAGSQAEYGSHQNKITEESICTPNTDYGKAKLAFFHNMSQLCAEAGVSHKEPRFFSLYGPGDYDKSLIITVLKAMLRNEPCKLTQGIQMWDFLYLDDAVEALADLCEEDCQDGVYNFGSGDSRPLKNYVLEMASITKTKSELLFGALPYPATGMVSLWPDISKLQSQITWKPHVHFEEGICRILTSLDP